MQAVQAVLAITTIWNSQVWRAAESAEYQIMRVVARGSCCVERRAIVRWDAGESWQGSSSTWERSLRKE